MGDLTNLKRSNRVRGLGCLPPDPDSVSITQGGKMKKYNYNFIIHLLLNKYGWTQEEIGAWTWKKTNGS